MSDVWQGPGWWLASDGKWYPEDGGPDADAAGGTDDGGMAADGGAAAAADHAPVVGIVEDAPVDHTTGGWEAVADSDNDLDGWTEPAIVVDTDTSAPAVAEPVEPVADQGGWTPAAEAPGFEPPIVDLAPGGVPVTGAPSAEPTAAPPPEPTTPDSPIVDTDPQPAAGAAAGAVVPEVDAPTSTPVAERGAPDVLERDEAWRKPTEATIGVDTTATARPAPVDIGLDDEEESVADLSAPAMEPTTARVLTGLLGLLILALIGGLIWLLFIRDGDDDVDTTGSPTTTASTAPVESTEPDETAADTGTDTDDATDDTPTETTVPGEIAVFDLRTGDCIEGNIGSGAVQRLIVVDCAEPHEFEVYREVLIDSEIETFDEEAISAQAEDVCRTALAAYVPDAEEQNIKFKWFQPTEESWNQPDEPDRVITCLLFDEDGPLTGTAGQG